MVDGAGRRMLLQWSERLGWAAGQLRQRWSARVGLTWSSASCLPVLRIVQQELAAGMLLVDVLSKSGRTFACVLRPVIGTVGTKYYINMLRSHVRATDARRRAQSKGPVRPFLPPLKRYHIATPYMSPATPRHPATQEYAAAAPPSCSSPMHPKCTHRPCRERQALSGCILLLWSKIYPDDPYCCRRQAVHLPTAARRHGMMSMYRAHMTAYRLLFRDTDCIMRQKSAAQPRKSDTHHAELHV
jgi:hypothetical protein